MNLATLAHAFEVSFGTVLARLSRRQGWRVKSCVPPGPPVRCMPGVALPVCLARSSREELVSLSASFSCLFNGGRETQAPDRNRSQSWCPCTIRDAQTDYLQFCL